MKKLSLVLALMFSSSLYAQSQCHVDIQNEVRVDGEQVEIYQQDQPRVLIDDSNRLYINGQQVELSRTQQQALEAYRANMNEYLPRAKAIARDGLALLNSVLDDMAVSLNNSEAFNNVKQALEQFLDKLEKRYQKGNQFVLQEAAFGEVYSNWQQDFSDAMDIFNTEFFSSAFTLLSDAMKQEGGVNLMALKDQMTELQSKLGSSLIDKSDELKKEAKQYCDDLESLGEQEQMLHEKIPALKDYKVLLI